MAYVDVPKDLTNIKTKFIGNFTKRQCVCFGIGVLVGFPGYFLARGALGTTGAFYVLIALMAPFFLFGIVEKDGLPLEVYLLNYIRHVFVYPQIRLMETENIYEYYDGKRKEEKKMKKLHLPILKNELSEKKTLSDLMSSLKIVMKNEK